MSKLNKNRGIFLISTFMVSSFLFVITGVYVSASIVQNHAVLRQKDTLNAFYAAERGLAYALVESQNRSFSWYTHNVDRSDLDEDGNRAELISNANVYTNPIPGASYNYAADTADPNYGEYQIALPNGLIEVKSYSDEGGATWLLSRATVNGIQKIVRLRMNTRSLYQYFFFFPSTRTFSGSYYNGKGVGGIHINRASTASSGDIILYSSYFKDLSELSCEGYIYYYRYQYSAPKYYDRDENGKALMYRSGSPPFAFYLDSSMYYKPAYHFYGDNSDRDPSTTTWSYISMDANNNGVEDSGERKYFPKIAPGANEWQWDKYAWSRSFGAEHDTPAVEFEVDKDIFGVEVVRPDTNNLDNPLDYLVKSEMNGNEYVSTSTSPTLLSKTNGITKCGNNYSEYQVYRFCTDMDPAPVDCGEMAINIEIVKALGFWRWWKFRNRIPLAADDPQIAGWKRTFWEAFYNWVPASGETHQTGPYWVNPEWWSDLKYGDDYQGGGENINVKYLDSEKQAVAWESWLRNNGLEGIIKERNTGGKQEIPLNIETSYSDLAKQNGLYIGTDSSGNLEIYLNGERKSALPAWVDSNVQFFNAARPHLDPITRQPIMENVIQIDINQLISSYSTEVPINNVVYVANKNVRLVNGSELPDGGLTVITPYNIYVKGNYNTDENWQPSAAITNSYIYLLSDDFNDPQNLPATHNFPTSQPFSLMDQNFLNSHCWGNSGEKYPSSLPRPEDGSPLTYDWIRNNLDSFQKRTLWDSGETDYDVVYEDSKTNRVQQDTRFNLAIVSPDSPYPSILERWYDDSNRQKTMDVEGAFIQLERPWSTTRDIPNTSRSCVSSPRDRYEYEEQFATAAGRPSGDFLSSFQSLWQEVRDFYNHT